VSTYNKMLRVRLKDKHSKGLVGKSNSVNYVWNYINELSTKSIRDRGIFLSGYDLQKYTVGVAKELGITSQTVQMIGHEYATRRKQFKKSKLKWRVSRGSRRSLGWIPFSGQAIQLINGQVRFNKTFYSIIDTYGLSKYKIKSGSFSEDSRGRWYLNVCVEVEAVKGMGTGSVGIDLGCKEAATDSNGDVVVGREYRKLEKKLATAQRARNKRQVKTIHAKIKNRRADTLHKYSRKLVNENAAIFVGNVSSSKLVKTNMAKSVLDAGWSSLKVMLKYKSDNACTHFEEINESYTTQICSCCGENPDSSPKGRKDLNKRDWVCSLCGAEHDRDVNAAINIRGRGLASLCGESPGFNHGE